MEKVIPGYENYVIDENANVYSIKFTHYSHGIKTVRDRRKKLIHTCIKGEYCYVSLMKDSKKKNFKLHHLMAKVFITKPKGDNWIIAHLDNNKHNNKLNNLKYIKQSENIQSAYDDGLIKGKGNGKIKVLVIKGNDKEFPNFKKEQNDFLVMSLLHSNVIVTSVEFYNYKKTK